MEALDLILNPLRVEDQVIFVMDIEKGSFSGIYEGWKYKGTIVEIEHYELSGMSIFTLELHQSDTRLSYLEPSDDEKYRFFSTNVVKYVHRSGGSNNSEALVENDIDSFDESLI